MVAGLPVSSRTAAGLTTTTAYDALLRPSEVTNPRGNKTKTIYRAGTRQVEMAIQPFISTGHANNITVATYSYDSSGRQIAVTDPQSHHVYSSSIRQKLHFQ